MKKKELKRQIIRILGHTSDRYPHIASHHKKHMSVREMIAADLLTPPDGTPARGMSNERLISLQDGLMLSGKGRDIMRVTKRV